MQTRYDVIVSFGLDISEHFYAGDSLVGGLTQENLRNMMYEGGIKQDDFFPELLSQLNSLFGDDVYMTTCTISEQDFSLYFRCELDELTSFEKKIIGWVIINELDKCFNHYCVIDYDSKTFKIKDVNGVETTDKLRGVTLVLEDDEKN